MLVSKAKAILARYDDDAQIGALFIDPDEVTDVCGEAFEHTDRILESLSREPASQFWYTHRDMFKALIATAERNRKEHEEWKLKDASHVALAEELGLKVLRISLDSEVRPMQRVTPVDLTVESLCFETFILPADSTYADLLILLDSAMVESEDHHIFLEDIRINREASMMEVGFGS